MWRITIRSRGLAPAFFIADVPPLALALDERRAVTCHRAFGRSA